MLPACAAEQHCILLPRPGPAFAMAITKRHAAPCPRVSLAQMLRWQTRWHPRCASSAHATTWLWPSPGVHAIQGRTACLPTPPQTPGGW